MPQLDFLIYFYQFILLFITFFLLYDLFLNYWLPGFLSSFYITARFSFILETVNSYFTGYDKAFFFKLLKKICYTFKL